MDTQIRRALQPLWNALDDVAKQFSPGCVLGVSGGPDSRALLEAFATWPALKDAPRVLVITVDHQRRPASGVEATAVGARCRELGLEHQTVAVSPAAGDEQSLRRARYAALADAARKISVGAICTAHHRGDVAEGLLLHLAGRGGGQGGRSPRMVEKSGDLVVVRPLLALPKIMLQQALNALEIEDVVVDEDDAASKNARAFIRNHLLAPLGEQRADIEAALARHARHRTEDDDIIEPLIPSESVVNASLPPALLRRWLLRQVAQLVDDPRTSPAAIDDVIGLCMRQQIGRVDLRGSHAEVAHKRGRGLVVAVIAGAGQSGRR